MCNPLSVDSTTDLKAITAKCATKLNFSLEGAREAEEFLKQKEIDNRCL